MFASRVRTAAAAPRRHTQDGPLGFPERLEKAV